MARRCTCKSYWQVYHSFFRIKVEFQLIAWPNIQTILRQLGENYSYSEFIRQLDEQRKSFNPAQSSSLEQRMTLLNSFLDPAARTGSTATSIRRASVLSTASASVVDRRTSRFAAGQLTIIDLSDPFIDPASAASLFDILLRLFVRADVGTGKVCVVDEAHKVCLFVCLLNDTPNRHGVSTYRQKTGKGLHLC